MKFEEALVELRKGKRIKRKCHRNYIYKSDPVPSNRYIFIMDILNDLDDWEVKEEPGKTFPEVFEAFKEGKNIRRKSWKEGHICACHINKYFINEDLLATDWEVIE